MSSFAQLTILIVGGSSGIGLSLARAALAAGHKAIVTSRSIEKARTQRPDIEKAGGQWFQLDITSTDTHERVSQLATSTHIDAVVNAAGYAALGAFEDFSSDQVTQQFDTNVFGIMRVCQGIVPHFRARKAGCIVNIGSGAGISGLQTRSLYSATKFALAGFSESLHRELQPFGVRVIIAELGAFATPFGDSMVYPARDTEEYADTRTGEMLRMARDNTFTSQNTAGDPDEAALRILEAISGQGLGAELGDDMRLVLGSDCMRLLKRKIDELNATVAKNERIAVSTDRKK